MKVIGASLESMVVTILCRLGKTVRDGTEMDCLVLKGEGGLRTVEARWQH